MKRVYVAAYPYAFQEGFINIPDNLKDDEIKNYIAVHFDDVEFSEPDLDYCGTDFEYYTEEY